MEQSQSAPAVRGERVRQVIILTNGVDGVEGVSSSGGRGRHGLGGAGTFKVQRNRSGPLSRSSGTSKDGGKKQVHDLARNQGME